MIKLSLTISDSSGILQTIEKSFSSPNVLTSFDEIEHVCESFISEAIPATKKYLLEKAQSHFTEQWFGHLFFLGKPDRFY